MKTITFVRYPNKEWCLYCPKEEVGKEYFKGEDPHYEGSYYPAAAVDAREAKVQRLVLAAKEVIRISDRKHDAWDELKAALVPLLKKEPKP